MQGARLFLSYKWTTFSKDLFEINTLITEKGFEWLKKLAYAIIHTVHAKRYEVQRRHLFLWLQSNSVLLETLVTLIGDNLPWACDVVRDLLQRDVFRLLREILYSATGSDNTLELSSLERVLTLIILHLCKKPLAGQWCNFSSEILTIPFLLHKFSLLKKVFVRPDVCKNYMHEVKSNASFIPPDSRYAYMENILEAATLGSFDMGSTTTILENMISDVEISDENLYRALEYHIVDLVNVLVEGIFPAGDTTLVEPIFSFLYVSCGLPLDRLLTILVYNTRIVPVCWSFIKQCHETGRWNLPGDWLLPLAVFCPIYKCKLRNVDSEEFVRNLTFPERQDIEYFVTILRQALSNLLLEDPVAPAVESTLESFAYMNQSVQCLRDRVRRVTWDLLIQLHDWNNKMPFVPSSCFHGDYNDIIVLKAPFLVSFERRLAIYYLELAKAKESRQTYEVTINQDDIEKKLSEKLLYQFWDKVKNKLSDKLSVKFVNEDEYEQDGVDYGGMFKSYMEDITRLTFGVKTWFQETEDDFRLYPCPLSGPDCEMVLKEFHILGTILAKAMYEKIPVNLPFTRFFLSHLKQKYNNLNDLPSLSQSLHKNLLVMKCHKEEELQGLELYFSPEIEFFPGGDDISVRKETVIPYIHMKANYHLNYQIRQQSFHFLEGFQRLIREEWMKMFSEDELQMLISGEEKGLDIKDLRLSTKYLKPYHAAHSVSEMLWDVLMRFSQEDQRSFLKFVTGCSRGPLLGFKDLDPQFCVQRNVVDQDYLPTSSTCTNTLYLPEYESKEKLEEKLLQAIAQPGFYLQ